MESGCFSTPHLAPSTWKAIAHNTKLGILVLAPVQPKVRFDFTDKDVLLSYVLSKLKDALPESGIHRPPTSDLTLGLETPRIIHIAAIRIGKYTYTDTFQHG